jgi:hypothetical protein
MNPELLVKDLLLQFDGNIDYAITCVEKLIIYIPFKSEYEGSMMSSTYWNEVRNELKKLKG